MKKILILLFLTALLLSLAFNLASCETKSEPTSNNNSNNQTKNETESETENETESAKEKLTYEEFCVNIIIESYLSDFKDPISVKIIEVQKRSEEFAIVKLSGKNSYGGTVTNDYIVFLETYKLSSGKTIALMGTMYEFNSFYEDTLEQLKSSDWVEFHKYIYETTANRFYSYNVKTMNEALNEYKAAQGWGA